MFRMVEIPVMIMLPVSLISEDSYKSSLGFLVTAETYIGDNGYSMRLDGIEKGFNDNVRNRAIVMHGSNYVGGDRAVKWHNDGTQFWLPCGACCKEVKNIVDCIKGGSCVFNYYPDKSYTQNSKILNATFVWPVAQVMQLASVKIPDSLKNMDTGFTLN